MTPFSPAPQQPDAHNTRQTPYYRAPDDLRRALGEKAKREARLRGVTPAHLTDRFYYHRFLARVFHHDPDGWILKGGQAIACLRHKERRRRGAGTAIRLPSRYTVPDPKTWPGGYAKAARDVPGLNGCASLEEAFPLADAILTPLLAGTAQGTWQPDRRTWACGQ